jgi:hypothetical protein
MSHECKFFFIRLFLLLFLTPFLGFCFLRYFEYFEKVWKTGSRRKKWLMMCILVFMLEVMSGFLR